MYRRTQVTGTGIGSQTVNSGEEVVLTCQVRVGSHSPCLIASIFFNIRIVSLTLILEKQH